MGRPVVRARLTHPRREAGDTLVEVMVSIAIASLVLVGAYASTNASTNTTEDTLEHSQALQLVQTQIEMLRTNGPPTTDTSPGCYDSSGNPQPDASSGQPDNCYFNADGSAGQSANPTAFHVTITPPGPTDPSNIYTVAANWPSILGGTANVTLYYGPPGGN